MSDFAGPVSVGEKSDITATASQLTTTRLPCKALLLRAGEENDQNVFIGDSVSQTILLAAGESLSLPTDTVNDVYARAVSSTQTVSWLRIL